MLVLVLVVLVVLLPLPASALQLLVGMPDRRMPEQVADDNISGVYWIGKYMTMVELAGTSEIFQSVLPNALSY